MQGDYVGLKFIAGRKVCQVIIEIPLEAGSTFVAGFGTPNPVTGSPVVIARMEEGSVDGRVCAGVKPLPIQQDLLAPDPVTVVHAKAAGGPISQRAGMLCKDMRFRTFVSELLSEPHVIDDIKCAM